MAVRSVEETIRTIEKAGMGGRGGLVNTKFFRRITTMESEREGRGGVGRHANFSLDHNKGE